MIRTLMAASGPRKQAVRNLFDFSRNGAVRKFYSLFGALPGSAARHSRKLLPTPLSLFLREERHFASIVGSKPVNGIDASSASTTNRTPMKRGSSETQQFSKDSQVQAEEVEPPTWKQIYETSGKLRKAMSQLKPLVLPIADSIDYGDSQQREQLFQQARALMGDIEMAVQNRNINPSGRRGRDISAIVGSILQFYSASHNPITEESIFDECLRVLSLLDQWNFSLQEPHYQYTILTAVHEQRWQEAAKLFLHQIDQYSTGMTAIGNLTVLAPVGLYAIAQSARQNSRSAVHPVMDAVQRICINAPTDRERIVLAAGRALGLAGECRGLISYLENSNNAISLGQPLTAATMYACILCNEFDEALRLFHTLLDGNLAISSEFQWDGGNHQVLPICRDLALRAMGGSVNSGSSDAALKMFHDILNDELSISEEALHGILAACENDQNWAGALEVLLVLILDHTSDRKLFIVDGQNLRVPLVPDMAPHNGMTGEHRTLGTVDVGKILSSVMRSCNSSNQFGVALTCFILADASTPGSLMYIERASLPDVGYRGSIEQTLAPLLISVENTPELLVVTMNSLCNLGCVEEALELFEMTKLDRPEGPPVCLADSEQMQQYAKSRLRASRMDNSQWDSAHRHMHRLAKTLHAFEQRQPCNLNDEQLSILGSALAAVHRCCNAAGCPEAGVVFSHFFQAKASRSVSSSAEAPSMLSLFRNTPMKLIPVGDSLLAEEMKALQVTEQEDTALSLFYSKVDLDYDLVSWPQSCSVAVDILANTNHLTEASTLFRELAQSGGSNIILFNVAARMFADAKQWSDVADVYHMANQKGCLSDEVGLLALKAVNKLTMPGKLRVLREIIDDAAQAAGTNSVSWLEANYWRLKQLLGFSTIRLLMWWNDPATANYDELQFAIETFEKRLKEGLTPKVAACILILSQARSFHEGEFPSEKKEVALVPRDLESWICLVRRVLEASDSLVNDGFFIDEAARSLTHLGCDRECVKLVVAAADRGVNLRQIAIKEALVAAAAEGIADEASTLRLLHPDVHHER